MSLIPSTGDSRGIALLVVTAVFVTVAACAVFLRVWARRIKKTPLCFNDYSVMFALFLMSALIASFTIQVVSGGLGQHQANVTLAMTEDLNKAFLAAEMIWALSNTSVKLSILHLYIMIFRIRSFRIITYILMGTTIIYCAIVILEAFLICRPLAFFWNKTIEGSCGNEQAIFLSTGILNLMIDVMVVILPMPMLWGLQMKVAKKIALTGIFGLGAGICVITILRITALKNLNFADFTYAIEPVAIWSVLEPTLGITSACLPVIQPVLHKLTNVSAFAWTKKSNVDRSGKIMRYGESDSKNFQRLNDNAFPLSETGGTQTHITSSDGKLSPSSEDLEAQAYYVDPPRTTINVRRDYEVESKAYVPPNSQS